MKLRNILICVILSVTAYAVSAQENGYIDLSSMFVEDITENIWKHYSFRPSQSPTTYALSLRKQFRLEFSPQIYMQRKIDTLFLLDNGDGRSDANRFFQEKRMFEGMGGRINISYTAFDNITFGAAFLYKMMIQDVGHLVAQFPDDGSALRFDVNNLYRHQSYNSMFLLGEMSGTYHNLISSFCAYELRTALSMGRGKIIFYESYGVPSGKTGRGYFYNDDGLQYNIFNHSFEAGVSVFIPKRWLQLTALLNVGYTTYFNKKPVGNFYSRQVYEQVVIPFNQHPWDLFCAPSLMLSINTPKVFSIRFHCGFETSVQHVRYKGEGIRPIIGWTLSWRITNAGNFPKNGVE